MHSKNFLSFTSLIIGATMIGCSGHSTHDSISDNGYNLIVIDETESVGERTILLSDLVENYSTITFENSESAFFKAWKPVISDNYVAIVQGSQRPILLFDRKGKYIAQIGMVGNGPGEYILPYDAFIDENRGAVYVTEMVSKSMLEYNLKGEYVRSFDIGDIRKASIIGADDDYVSIASLAFKDIPDGPNAVRVDPINNKHESVRHPSLSSSSFVDNNGNAVGFNNEVWAFKNTPNNAFMFTNNDTLYSYDSKNNKIQPRAILNERNGRSEDSWYMGIELPSAIAYQVNGKEKRLMWKDKETGTVSNAELINDFCGNAEISTVNFRNGYFVQIWEPGQLIDHIEENWSNNDMTKEQRKKLDELLESIDPEGNDIMFIGKLKHL